MNAIKKETTDWTMDDLQGANRVQRSDWAWCLGAKLGWAARHEGIPAEFRRCGLVRKYRSIFAAISASRREARRLAGIFSRSFELAYVDGPTVHPRFEWWF